MRVISVLTRIIATSSVAILAGCQVTGFSKVSKETTNTNARVLKMSGTSEIPKKITNILPLRDIVANASPKINPDTRFAAAVAEAVKSSPKVQIAKSKVIHKQARLGVTKSGLDFQFSGTVYAGIEDVTDDTTGIAAVLTASRIIYDSGQISNAVLADRYSVQSSVESYRAILEERALEVSNAWVELERYTALNALVSGRLNVLDPLIIQLERIADAGVGDATQVAAAQRTVAMIRVTQTDVEESLAQAELNFVRAFGNLPSKETFDSAAIATAIPENITDKMIVSAPGLLASYADYLSALSGLEAAKVRNGVTVGLETKMQRPFGNSGYDSDESVGVVVRKTLYNGDKLKSEIDAARALVDVKEGSVKDIYVRGKLAVDAAMQSIVSLEKGIELARSNSQALSNEIDSLRKQLVIGQSTLESVLTAEARLYDIEAKEIEFIANKRSSQLKLLAAMGRLAPLMGIDPKIEMN